jgi:hypothetical protein
VPAPITVPGMVMKSVDGALCAQAWLAVPAAAATHPPAAGPVSGPGDSWRCRHQAIARRCHYQRRRERDH